MFFSVSRASFVGPANIRGPGRFHGGRRSIGRAGRFHLAFSFPVLTRHVPLLLAAPALLLLGGAAVANDFWLQPPRFFVAPGTRQTVRVLTGQHFLGRPWPGKSSRLARFVHLSPTDSTDLTAAARQTDTLTTSVEFRAPGVHQLAFSTTGTLTTLLAPDFNAYLAQEGLSEAQYQRRQAQETTLPARELYRRCAKTLLLCGAPSAATGRAATRPAGHPLELVPDQNPYALLSGASLTVRVLADGQPVRGALVRLWYQPPGQPAQASELHTNASGRLLFKLAGAGSYLLSTVRMARAPDPKTADWESTWATLTFGMAGISGR